MTKPKIRISPWAASLALQRGEQLPEDVEVTPLYLARFSPADYWILLEKFKPAPQLHMLAVRVRKRQFRLTVSGVAWPNLGYYSTPAAAIKTARALIALEPSP
jgi:hypothetical protein